ncbi:tRNA (adenosine(37)-N6)-threonylcarbamoyltransferase complex ATPase subunit type 1 TsaE [Microaerobacter geothermalis]|uniref:tRNA (adenosine(37)-N6)-threonylcarbamoyltransferase complex ATPase subunit type 1 TsaE n=1 Tax=Microaerobacter geothermalis TaxID=674972 RepID=UPI001F01CEFC|nr:tRNA (adenosine(37)-N6)-threonylcarbamoyltransferase complex ATPase subunit type 1 TsaE [Microaerobacter geothermalis]MCF6093740.1 tRNA (adenosine(37)-N6)-threonylcarbamoyltransferase complex ATPase subunit type 1 TsaE [Microaerobacter geothermalis]
MNKEYRVLVHSPEETKGLAERLASYLQSGDVITLEGDLGAGKTCFTQGIARGLDIKDVVNSPTFTLIKEYQGKLPLYHMDVYRLENTLDDLGFDEYFYGDGVSVIEWASFIEDLVPQERLEVSIRHLGENMRKIIFTPKGERYIQLLKELLQDENISH